MRIGRIGIALVAGALCHGIFALAGLAMFVGLYFGMTLGLGDVPWPWAILANALLLIQFPLGHSGLLTKPGMTLLARVNPGGHGRTLATTTYATIASIQLLLLFAFWTPSGVVWWRAEGWTLWTITALYLGAWGLLTKASFDAGPELQSGLLGWWALARGRAPRFPDMPTTGMFRVIRQPIYASFALTLWAVPIWTPDQLIVASAYTAYCLIAPMHKERRFERMFGERFEAYRAQVPYWLPIPRRARRPAGPEAGSGT